MFALQISPTPINVFPDIKKHFNKIKNDLVYNFLYKSLDYLSAATKINIEEMQAILDTPNNIEFIKRIDLDTLYENHFKYIESLEELKDKLQNKIDKKSISLLDLIEIILDDLAKEQWLISDVEHLLVEDRRLAC